MLPAPIPPSTARSSRVPTLAQGLQPSSLARQAHGPLTFTALSHTRRPASGKATWEEREEEKKTPNIAGWGSIGSEASRPGGCGPVRCMLGRWGLRVGGAAQSLDGRPLVCFGCWRERLREGGGGNVGYFGGGGCILKCRHQMILWAGLAVCRQVAEEAC